MLPDEVRGPVAAYAADLDRLLPGRVVGLYVVGSVALGAYRVDRSDIDLVGVLDGAVGPAEVRGLRRLHVRSAVRTGSLAVRQRRSPLTGTCNAVFVGQDVVDRPVGEIAPVAAHIGHTFTTGPVGSDISPVAWKVLAEQGIAVRGPEPAGLGLRPEPERLAAWNLENLEQYWRPWATRSARSRAGTFRLRPRWSTAWGALGAPRLHCTISTGRVVSKEAAGEYALDVLAARHHPVVREALAWWRDEPDRPAMSVGERRRRTTELVLDVVASARDLVPPG